MVLNDPFKFHPKISFPSTFADMQKSASVYSNPEKQLRYDRAYLRMALEWARLSHCQRKKVGAIIVKDGTIIADGYNGTPTGFENQCEDENGLTKWYVLHAEANAILKVARTTNNANGATLYLTNSPCKDCSKLVLQAGIKRLVYINAYKDTTGIDFLKKAGLEVTQIESLDL
jgi:dCMP deaminase